MRLLVALLLAAACAAPAHAVAVPKSGGEQALNLAADVSLSATSVRALFADWLAKFKRVYREGDEVRRLAHASVPRGSADAPNPCPLAAALGRRSLSAASRCSTPTRCLCASSTRRATRTRRGPAPRGCVGAAALLGHRHVAQASRGAAPQVALNAFADLTAEEFAAQRLGAHLHGAASRRAALTLRQQGTGLTPQFAPRDPRSPSAMRA